MAQYTYDPTQGKVVPLSQARSITYISNDPEGIPDEQAKKAAAAAAVKAAEGAGIPTAAPNTVEAKKLAAAQLAYDKAFEAADRGGFQGDELYDWNLMLKAKAALDEAKAKYGGGAETDSQNAARLEAEKAYALSPAGMRAALDKITADEAAKAYALGEPGRRDREAAVPIDEVIGETVNLEEVSSDDVVDDGEDNAPARYVNPNVVPKAADDYASVNGILNFKGSPFSGQYNGKYYTDGKESSPKGPAWAWNGKAFVQPPMPTDGKTYTWNDAKGWIASTLNTATITATQTDAIAGIIALLGSYGIGDLGDAITKAIINGYSPDTIQLIMQDPNSNDPLAVAFQKRFPANKVLAGQGKAVLSAGEYLAAEKRYTEIMQSYGVAGLATRATLSDFIGNSISATEVSDRVGLAVDRVQNADSATKKMLATYYPMLNTNDIVTAMLNPKEGLPALQRKVQIAEIGGAALSQGLNTSINSMSMKSALYSNVQSGALGAQQLAEFGVTKDQARAGYQQVAEITPRAEFLSSISGGEDYTRLEAEQEAFLGLASAKRARENLVKQEQGRFAGSSGLTKNSLSSSTKGQY